MFFTFPYYPISVLREGGYAVQDAGLSGGDHYIRPGFLHIPMQSNKGVFHIFHFK
jgi:hypothetical protein